MKLTKQPYNCLVRPIANLVLPVLPSTMAGCLEPKPKLLEKKKKLSVDDSNDDDDDFDDIEAGTKNGSSKKKSKRKSSTTTGVNSAVNETDSDTQVESTKSIT